MNGIDPQRQTSVSRLTLIDGIRGYLLIAMFIAHLAIEMRELGQRSWLNHLRHSRYLPIGDVEFFLFLSGFVAALAYQPAFAKGGIRGAGRAVFRRIRWLYVYQVAATMTLILLVAAGLTGVDLRASDATASTGKLLLQSLTFVVMPENLDILMLYIVMMPVMPWVLAWLGERRFGRLLWALIIAWSIARLGADVRAQQWLIANGIDWRGAFSLMGHFNPLSFALLFYGGFAIGHEWGRVGPAALARLQPLRVPLLATALASVAVYGTLTRVWGNQAPWVRADTSLLSGHTFISTMAIVYLGYWLLGTPHRAPVIVRMADLTQAFFSWRFFVFLGRNSLFVYAIHVVAIALAKHVVASGALQSSQFATLVVAAIWLALIGALTVLKRRLLPKAA